MDLDEKEYDNIYAIPANYTDAGKLFGGLLETRNAVETLFLMLLAGYPELVLFDLPGTVRIVVMTVTLLPLAVLSMMGIDGDSLFQYLYYMARFLARRRKLHCRRVGYRYETGQLRKKKRPRSGRKKKGRKEKTED